MNHMDASSQGSALSTLIPLSIQINAQVQQSLQGFTPSAGPNVEHGRSSSMNEPPRRAKVTATSNIKASAKSSPSISSVKSSSSSTNAKKPSRDSNRRATHSQIERRRREKINDRLVTLRSLVPACAAEIEERKRQRRQEEEEARQIAAGLKVATNTRGKRKRNRRKAPKAQQDGDKEDESGLHKLEVLTHTIDYIYELQDCIRELRGDNVDITPRRRARKQVESDQEEEQGDDVVEEEEGSDADLEMAEWKPSVKRKLVEFNSHRSNGCSSDATSSLNASPAIMSLSAESPMFSTTTSCSNNSGFTNLTSPMMSLSSESPILRWNNQISSSSSASSPSSKKEKETSVKTPSAISSWQLPAPALPLSNKIKNGMVKGSRHHALKIEDASQREDSAKEAQLLLNLSSSPEVLRPISALRQTFRPVLKLQRRKSTTVSAHCDARVINDDLTRIGGSAPGGAHPSTCIALVSPPLLELDAPLS